MDGKIILQFLGGDGKRTAAEFAVAGSTGIRLGSDPNGEVCFKDNLVSPVHCRLDLEPPCIKLTDLDSRHGTFVNRQRILGSVILRSGDILHLGAGGPKVEFDFDATPIPATPASNPRHYRLLAAGALLLLIAAAALAFYATALMGASEAL